MFDSCVLIYMGCRQEHVFNVWSHAGLWVLLLLLLLAVVVVVVVVVCQACVGSHGLCGQLKDTEASLASTQEEAKTTAEVGVGTLASHARCTMLMWEGTHGCCRSTGVAY